MFVNYLKNRVSNLGYYLSNIVLNYFLKKMIKQYSVDNKKINLSIDYNSTSFIIITIINLNLINIYNKLFEILIIPHFQILFSRNIKSPEIIIKITNMDIVSKKYVLDFSNGDFIKNLDINSIINVKNSILSGLDKVDRIVNKLTNNQKYIINTINIINNDIIIRLKQIYITRLGEEIIFKYNTCRVYYKKNNLLKISKIRARYSNSKTNININKINLKIDDGNNLIEKIEELIFKKYSILFSDDNNSNVVINVDCIIIEVKNNNKLLLKLRKLEYKLNKSLNIEKIEVISQYKRIVLIDKFNYNIFNSTSEVNCIKIDLYKSLPFKLHKFFKKYILTKLHSSLIPEFVNMGSNLKYKYIDKTIFDNNNNLNMVGDDMSESIISSNYLDKSPQNIVDILVESYIMDNKNINLDKSLKTDYINTISDCIKFKVYIKDITIKTLENNILCNIINLDNILYILDDSDKILIKCMNFIISDKNKIPIIKKNNQSSPIIEILFLKQTLSVSFSSIYMNLKIEEFKQIYGFIDIINRYYKSSVYSEEYVDYKKDNFIFNKITIHPFKLIVFYYPDNCNYYKILIGKVEELYKITNYENVNLNMNEITITYPYDFIEMMSLITTKWLGNIKNTQINSIIKGTKFKKANSIQNKLVYDIKKLIDISLKKLSGK